MDKLTPDGDENIVFQGRIFEVVKKPMKSGKFKIEFEIVRRSPGLRLLIIRENKILLTKEFRNELNEYDYRLPGGKVFDTLDEYRTALESGKNILDCAILAAKRECLEETGLIVKQIEHLKTSKAGATVTWDLFYFIVTDFDEGKKGQQLETGEVIYPEWKSFNKVKEMCSKDKFNEDRTVGILLNYFLKNNI